MIVLQREAPELLHVTLNGEEPISYFHDSLDSVSIGFSALPSATIRAAQSFRAPFSRTKRHTLPQSIFFRSISLGAARFTRLYGPISGRMM